MENYQIQGDDIKKSLEKHVFIFIQNSCLVQTSWHDITHVWFSSGRSQQPKRTGFVEPILNGFWCQSRRSRSQGLVVLRILALFSLGEILVRKQILSFQKRQPAEWRITRWFQIFFMFIPYLGKIPILIDIFQMGWNHQLENVFSLAHMFWTWGCIKLLGW